MQLDLTLRHLSSSGLDKEQPHLHQEEFSCTRELGRGRKIMRGKKFLLSVLAFSLLASSAVFEQYMQVEQQVRCLWLTITSPAVSIPGERLSIVRAMSG